MKVVSIGGTYAVLEELSGRVKGVEEVREAVAGMGGAAIFSFIGKSYLFFPLSFSFY